MENTLARPGVRPAVRPAVRTRREQLRNGGRGALIGTAFGLMWFALGQPAVHGAARPAVLGAGLLLLAASAAAVVRLFVLARRTPADEPGLPMAPAPAGGPKFLTVVLVQAVALGVGNGFVRGSLHRPELMLSWSALVVGAHFFPMARSLSALVLRVVGVAMISTVGLAALAAALLPAAPADVWQAVPGIGCAAVLWTACAVTGLRVRRRSAA
ncbi:hypothetical protein EF910_02930 [Streptomyces sp. WAC07149]|uniref:hypothetical protein n=1 Tax=Streptomyces sp. WAC07149 TaxID=2487425 RepID=UPI000F77BB20|nr:hypothetical protein [Streptomyces sp. WAC07149]RST08263.1 hypothetical protein EF910_02930 [Streptomyces sp. WAC07149]